MAHDIFVSYSSKDKPVADAVVAGLEGQGIRCWIAPRDVLPGTSWGDAIVSAIASSKIMVVVLSENSNNSRQVIREVERAVASNVIIIPFRIENIDPTGAMAYFLSTEHWLDALTPPLERHIQELQTTIQLFLSGGDRSVLSEHLSQPAARPAAPFYRRQPLTIPAVLLGIVILAVLAVIIIPRWLAQVPSAVPAVPVGAAEPTTITPASTPTPTQTPTATPPPAFRLVGSYATSREARSVFVQGDLAYIANAEDGLLILDVSDPAHPQKAGSFPLDNAENVVVVDDIAYVVGQGQVREGTAEKDKLILIDVKIPSVPRILSEYTPESGYSHRSMDRLAVDAEHRVYLTVSDTLMIVDASDPSQPATLGEFSFFSNISSPGVTVVDGIAYLQANELIVVDVRNPAEPAEIGGFDAGWGANVAVQDQTAYLAGWDTGLTILDVSTPAQPIKLGQFREPVGNYELVPAGAASRQIILGVSVSGEIAYLAYSFGLDQGTWTSFLESGVVAVDISNPRSPTKIATFSEFDNVSGLFATDDLVFVTDSTRGLSILSKPQ
jgi:hypothetical protein